MSFLDLPDELLARIVQELDNPKYRPRMYRVRRSSPSPLLSLSLVSRRINRIAEENIYRNLNLNIHNFPQCRALITALKQRPYRFAFIEYLQIRVNSVCGDETLQSLQMVLDKSPDIKQIELLGCDAGIFNLPIFKALNARHINSLDTETFVMSELTKLSVLRDLKILHIEGIRPDCKNDNGTRGHWWKEYQLPYERQGISKVQNLTVTFENDNINAVGPLLSWIAALRSLGVDLCVDRNQNALNFKTSELQQLLDVHCNTLRSITLGSYNMESIPSFRHFKDLRKLQLSHYELFKEQPKDAAWSLSAPVLRKLVISFDREDVQGGDLLSLKTGHCSWISDFVEYYRIIIDTQGIAEIYMEEVDIGNVETQTLLDLKDALAKQQICLTWDDYD